MNGEEETKKIEEILNGNIVETNNINISPKEEEINSAIEVQNNQQTPTVKNNHEDFSVQSLQTYADKYRIAKNLSVSTIVPQTFQNKPENVIVAMGLAEQMNLPVFTVMQNMSLIKGKVSWSGSFCKTLIEKTGRFKNLELNYVGERGKDNYGCYLSAVRISDDKIINGPLVTMEMARAEGWTSNKKWLTMTDLMLGYRCQSFFARLHCPEALGGVYTSEEMEDVRDEKRTVKDVL